jgi:non-specific serine/threonine protein kinase
MLEEAEEAPILNERVAVRLAKAFAEGTGQGLLQLGAGEVGQALPPVFTWWRGFSTQYVVALCLLSPEAGDGASLCD